MTCEVCGREATVHVTAISGGKREDHYFCETCARERGEFNLFTPTQQALESWIAGLTGMVPTQPAMAHEAGVERTADPRCPTCGMTFSQFARTGLLGCPDCYQALREPLLPVIRRMQGANPHTGKVPRRTGGAARRMADLRRLREALARAVQQERYEEAARLRDEIRKLEAEAGEGTSGGTR